VGTFQKAMLYRMLGGIRMNTAFGFSVLIFKDLNELVVRVLLRFALLRLQCGSGL
jgi:hypothetical protein